MQGAHEVRGSAAVAATDLQHPFAAEIRLGRRAVVQVDVGSVGLVGRLQRQGHRRILLIGPVDEHKFVGTEPACHQRVPVPPDPLVGRGTSHAGEEAVGRTEGHGQGVWQTRNTNDPIAEKRRPAQRNALGRCHDMLRESGGDALALPDARPQEALPEVAFPE